MAHAHIESCRYTSARDERDCASLTARCLNDHGESASLEGCCCSRAPERACTTRGRLGTGALLQNLRRSEGSALPPPRMAGTQAASPSPGPAKKAPGSALPPPRMAGTRVASPSPGPAKKARRATRRSRPEREARLREAKLYIIAAAGFCERIGLLAGVRLVSPARLCRAMPPGVGSAQAQASPTPDAHRLYAARRGSPPYGRLPSHRELGPETSPTGRARVSRIPSSAPHNRDPDGSTTPGPSHERL